MKKRAVRVFKGYAHHAGVYNQPVFFLSHDGYKISLAICSICSALFVIDWENPATEGLSIKDLSKHQSCPQCSAPLEQTIMGYPESFVAENGEIGSFIPPTTTPVESEGEVVHLWELTPALPRK